MSKKVYYDKIMMSESRRAIILFSLIFLCSFLTACHKEQMIISDESTRFAEQVADMESLDNPCRDEENEKSTEMMQSAETMLVVHICGAVNDEGVYELETGSRIIDAVNMAGGLTDSACERAVNLSEKLEDAQRIYIPTLEEVENGSFRNDIGAVNDTGTVAADDGRVNINTADANLLMSLNGIGSTRAEAIIAYREENGEFKKEEDIMNVSGIGESSYQKLKEKIKVK